MENLNNVPSTGTFGGSINQVNQNFGLVKDAIENVEGRTIRSKGLFPTQAALTAAYPSPKVGDYAYVGSSLPATIYDCEVEGTWHNTQQQGGSESVPLNNYPTKSEMNAAIAAIEIETVDNLNEETAASGKALDAHQGFVLAGQIGDVQESLSKEKGDLNEVEQNYLNDVFSFEQSSTCKRATRGADNATWEYKDIPVTAGDTVKILIEGNISKTPTLSDARQYFEIQQLDSSSQVDSTLYSVYTAIPDNNPTARIIDSNTPTLTSKAIMYKVPINGYLRIRNRMSTTSNYAVNVITLGSLIDNSNYKELPIDGLTWKNMTYRSQGDFHAATTRLSCAIDTTNVKSIKIIPLGYINVSVNEFGEEWVKEAENFTTDVPISANTNLYAQGLQANSIEHTMNGGSKTFVITLGKSDNSNISVSDISNKLTIYVEYKEEKKRNIRVLFIGNSLLQDAVSYMPFYMKSLAPDVEFSFYLWYHSGYRLAQHLSDFENNVPATIFSTNYGTKWNQYANSMTMAQVLAKYEFDIVVIQEYFYYWYSNNLPYTDTDLQTFNDVVAWVESHSNSPFKVATFFHPPRMNATDVEPSFTFISNNIVKILKNTVAEGMLFSGIALYRALSTDLMNLGITGFLSADNVHSQEGLPCSLCAWTSIMWLLDELGMVSRINNIQDYVNSTNWASLNIPGPNPTNTASNPSTYVISGTDGQKKLAQEVAVKAHKECKAFVNIR